MSSNSLVSILAGPEEEWIRDDVLSRRMPQLLDEVLKHFPDEDLSLYKEKAKSSLIPNPFILEKSDKEPLIFLAGLIHREYAIMLLVGILGIRVTDEGRAVIGEGDEERDVTAGVLNLIPQLTSACALSIRDLSVVKSYAEEIGELLNVVALLMYLSVVLRSPPTLEKILSTMAYTMERVRDANIRNLIGERMSKELRELGLKRIAEEFLKIGK